MNRSFFAAFAVCALGVAQAQSTYTLTEIGTNDPTTSTNATGINDEGDLALTVTTGGNASTWIWHHGTQTNIGGLTSPPASLIESAGLNDLTQIVGTTQSPPVGGAFVGFLWQQGHMTLLPSPVGFAPVVFALDINLLGRIAGQAFDNNFIPHVVEWNHGQVTVLPDIPGAQFSEPEGINILGDIVGVSFDASDTPNTVLWHKGVPTTLVAGSTPAGINDEGAIVGILGSVSTGVPFVWQNGTTTTLPPVAGQLASGSASAINDLGLIVGANGNVAVLWRNGTATDLNTHVATTDPLQPFVHLQAARYINNFGQIVATGVDSRNPSFVQTYLLTPAH